MSAPSVESYVVGKFYRVPCMWATCGYFKGHWAPILGPKHEDREIINFPDDHWHIDWRFAQAGPWRRASQRMSPLAVVVSPGCLEGEVVIRRLKCRREMPSYPSLPFVPWLPELENAFQGARLKCGVCPHRGLDLRSLPADADGVKICPGHGLAWKANGELHRRVAV